MPGRLKPRSADRAGVVARAFWPIGRIGRPPPPSGGPATAGSALGIAIETVQVSPAGDPIFTKLAFEANAPSRQLLWHGH